MFDDGGMVLDAVLAGAGLGYVLEERATSHVKSGALTLVLADWCPPFPRFHLCYPGRRQISSALAAFIDAIRWRKRERKRP